MLGEVGDGVIHFLSTIYNYNTMPNPSIQNGGAFITVINPTTGKREIISDPIGNSRVLFDNLQTVQCISVSSYGSFVFVGEIPQPEPERPVPVHIRSQTRSKTRRPLTQREALARPRNIEHGKPITQVCMKVVFVGDKPDRINDLYTKEIVTLDTAVQEVQTQHRMYRKLISGGTGANTEIIPDAFGSCLLTHEDFKALTLKSNPSSSPIRTQDVLNFIERIAKTHNLQLYVSFIEYLIDYSPFNESNDVHKSAVSTIGAYVLAIFLKTGCISLDMHSGNIMIHKTFGSVQFIDFGRLICLFETTGKAELKKWFKAYSEYCDHRDLEYLHMCFSPVRDTGVSVTRATAAEVQADFNTYCDTLETRLQRWLTPRPTPTTIDDIKEVFDLLTFIGFIDCLRGFSKKRSGQTIFSMQFGLCMNLLLGREIGSPFLIDDIIRIRSNIHDLENWIRRQTRNKEITKRLTGVVEILSESLPPDEALGTPRSADSFEYREDSDVEQEILVVDEASSPKKSERKRSRSPERSRGRGLGLSQGRGGRRPRTYKPRRVKRKTRVSRRKY